MTRLMDACRGNISLASRASGIHRSYLQRLLTRHDIRGAPPSGPGVPFSGAGAPRGGTPPSAEGAPFSGMASIGVPLGEAPSRHKRP